MTKRHSRPRKIQRSETAPHSCHWFSKRWGVQHCVVVSTPLILSLRRSPPRPSSLIETHNDNSNETKRSNVKSLALSSYQPLIISYPVDATYRTPTIAIATSNNGRSLVDVGRRTFAAATKSQLCGSYPKPSARCRCSTAAPRCDFHLYQRQPHEPAQSCRNG